MKIRAIFKGPTDAGFIELQMTAPGQTFVSGQYIQFYGAGGAAGSKYNFTHDVANGPNQGTILVGDTSTGGNPDFTFSGLGTDLSLPAGAACYSTIDCVSWGAFTGNSQLPTSAGTPISGLSTNMIAIRGITRGCATALDEADDTGDGSDFTFGFFTPRNNSVSPTETVCPGTTTGTPPAATKKKCKKKKHRSAEPAKKTKCKKKKH
jgi:hypothetical protein